MSKEKHLSVHIHLPHLLQDLLSQDQGHDKATKQSIEIFVKVRI